LKQLYFIRHGQTEWNAIKRMQGRWNSNLNETGRQQADVNGRFLASQNIESLFISPLDRTRQTAEIINRHTNLPVILDDRIMEWDCGDWSGYMYAEIQAKWPEDWNALQADRFNHRGPNCENYPDMIERSGPFLEEIQNRAEDNIAIVSHGMIGRVMVAQLLGLNEKDTLGFHQSNDLIFRVTLQGGSVEVSHFVGGEGPVPGLGNT
jgi:broad specificity phosphatase PhoE